MSDSTEWFSRCAALAACLLLAASRVGAQQLAPPPPDVPPTTTQFLSRSDFHLMIDALAANDPRFVWDTHVGGDFDVVDYVHGRTTILADYQAVLGSEFRPFDPNQGNYTLEAASSARLGPLEFTGAFHHVSRHLSDRPKRFAIAWNELEARVAGARKIGATTIDVRGDVGDVVQHSYVDYAWTADAHVGLNQTIAKHADAYVRGYAETFGVDHSISTRGRQSGGRAEGGVRLSGRGAAIELFIGYERVVDADPIQELPLQWGFAGFRLLDK